MSSAPQFFGADLTSTNFRFTSTAFVLIGSNGSGASNGEGTEAQQQLILRAAGTLAVFSANVTVNSSAASVTTKLRNQSGNLTSSLSIGTSTGQFQDLSHTDSMASGDKLSCSPTGGTSLANFTMAQVGVKWTPSSGQSQFYTSNNLSSFFSASTNYFQAFAGGFSAALSSTEAPVQMKVRAAGTASNLAIYLSANANANSLTFAFRKGGVSGSQTMTIAAATTGYQEDVSHTDSVASGDLVNSIMTTGSGSISMTAKFTAVLISPTGTIYDLFSNAANTLLSNANDDFLPLLGSFFNNVTTEANAQIKYPFAESFQNLRMLVGSNANALFTFKTRIANADGGQSFTLSATGYNEDVSHTDTCAANDLVGFKVVHGTGTGPTVTGTGITSGISLVTVSLTGVSAAGAVKALTPETDATGAGASAAGAAGTLALGIDGHATLVGASAAGAAGALTPGASLNLAGVAAAGAVNGPTPEVDTGAAAGASAAGAPGTLAIAYDSFAVLTGASSACVAGASSITDSSNVSASGVAAAAARGLAVAGVGALVQGVSAACVAGTVSEAFPQPVFLPVLRIMRNTPVPSIGAMSNEAVATIGRLLPSGPSPLSTAVHLSGASAQCRAAAIAVRRNVKTTLVGASAQGQAGIVIGA